MLRDKCFKKSEPCLDDSRFKRNYRSQRNASESMVESIEYGDDKPSKYVNMNANKRVLMTYKHKRVPNQNF